MTQNIMHKVGVYIEKRQPATLRRDSRDVSDKAEALHKKPQDSYSDSVIHYLN